MIRRFGLHGFEDPFDKKGPLSPLWSVAPILEVAPVRTGGPGLVELAGAALAGLRLAGGTLILKLERGGRAQQVRIAAGGAFDSVRDTLKVTLNAVSDWPRLHARAGDLWRLLRVPAPPTGRGRGPRMMSCCRRST